jgi:hypothetical protein
MHKLFSAAHAAKLKGYVQETQPAMHIKEAIDINGIT